MCQDVGKECKVKAPVGKKRPFGSTRGKLWRKSLAKVKATEVARVELRAAGGFHGPEKPGWSAGGNEK